MRIWLTAMRFSIRWKVRTVSGQLAIRGGGGQRFSVTTTVSILHKGGVTRTRSAVQLPCGPRTLLYTDQKNGERTSKCGPTSAKKRLMVTGKSGSKKTKKVA